MVSDVTTKNKASQVEDSSHSTGGVYSQEGKDFNRDTRYIDDRIVRDGREVGQGIKTWPVEAGRYRLIAARACPWAHRTLIVRRLLGLEDAISVGIPGPVHDARSWTFDKGPGGRDEILGYERLQEAFLKRFPDYQQGITVPAIVEIESGEVVTNDFPWITLDFITEWAEFHREGDPDLYPVAMSEEMDELMQFIYTEINNGVYRCGFAGSQDSYDKAYDRLFSALDKVSERLETRRYLMATTSLRPTFAFTRPSSASMRSTTATSSAIGTRSPRCRFYTTTCVISSRLRASATPLTLSISSATTTRSTATSIL